MMHYITAIILGMVEGLTEFLPVSSTGHLILSGEILNFKGDNAKTFEIFIQLGSILAVVVVFWKRFLNILGLIGDHKNKLNILHIIFAMIPAVILGLLLHDAIKTYLFSSNTVVIGLVAGGILMIYAEKKKAPNLITSLDTLTYAQAFKIGLFQCLALWPGFSRSGSTISGGLLVGADRKVSADFSFIVAVPMMVAASGLDLLKSYDSLSMSDVPFFAVGFVTAFIMALLAIKIFLKVVAKVKLTPFAYYRFILAIVVYLFLNK
ncbi:undecaprenyl-diphosphate phosphatase [Bacillus sp. 1NLA3E]|uniref:undecaprenyl-diphosphate phosphatase n=1 Tax=Bacillus sp. 1NLA3E TaxID=666686 RepID=UPI000247ED52|nr:undecaprenyl-diphosphate phosphatase [Bacillus sp. 1NLA3E]AGK55672.1 undecaprenyl pyrophosphate phosphatase [Bacillus sp. 1NLA3E]